MSERAAILQRLLGSLETPPDQASPRPQPHTEGPAAHQAGDPIRQQLRRQRARQRRIAAVFFRRKQ
jgi:hypothetical protein